MEDKTVKLEHFKNLVAVAAIDGYLDESEKEFLSQRAQDVGLTIQQIDNILDNADQLKFVVPFNNVDKEEQLSDVVYMAMVDGEIAEREYNLCLTIAERLGLNQNDVDEVVNLTKKLWEK